MIDAQRYPAQVFYSEDDEGFIAVATDLPGCSAFGETQEQAVSELRSAIAAWQIAAAKAGNPVPAPSKHQIDDLPSGKILLRLPRSLHAQLIEQAKQEGVSLNQHLVSVLTVSTTAHFIPAIIAEHILSIGWESAATYHHPMAVRNLVSISPARQQIQTTGRYRERPFLFPPVKKAAGFIHEVEAIDG